MDEMRDAGNREAMSRAKELFDRFDIDNEKHCGIIIMFDGENERLSMVALNSNAIKTMVLLVQAMTILRDAEDGAEGDRVLN